MHTTLKFRSVVSVFLIYLILKAAPIVALVYYFFDWQEAVLSACILLLIILFNSGRTNHHFTLLSDNLTVHQSLFFWISDATIPYASIQQVELKYSTHKDNRQWLTLHYKDGSKSLQSKKYRCDWIHMQEPLDDDDHEHPDNELFEILEDEDFYEGSMEHLANELRNRGLSVEEII